MRLFGMWLCVSIGMGIGAYLWSGNNWFHDFYLGTVGAAQVAFWAWADGYEPLARRGPLC